MKSPSDRRKKNPTLPEVLREADLQSARYQAKIKFQSERLDAFLGFLHARGLVDDFNEWEELRRQSMASS